MIKLLSYILFERCIYILALEVACPGNQHCANCIGTLSFPIFHNSRLTKTWFYSAVSLFYLPSQRTLLYCRACVRACVCVCGRVSACVYDCLSVRDHIFGTTRSIFSSFFVDVRLLMAVAQSSSGSLVIRCVFPVLWMTSYIFT